MPVLNYIEGDHGGNTEFGSRPNLKWESWWLFAVGQQFELPMVSFMRTRGHGGRVVTLSPLTSEAGDRFLAWPQVGKLVVACRWSAVYSTQP